jgi:hypothetical protein
MAQSKGMFTLQQLLNDIFQNQKKFGWTNIFDKFVDTNRSSSTKKSCRFDKTNRSDKPKILIFDI